MLECSNVATLQRDQTVMPKTTLSSRELNQDLGRAKRAAKDGPVVITDRGEPAFVLTTFEDHQKATSKERVLLLDALSLLERLTDS